MVKLTLKQLPNYWCVILACFAGYATTLAFSPHDYSTLAIIGPALLIILWRNMNPKVAFFIGYCYGIGFFASSVWWVVISLHQQGHLALPLAWLAVMFFMSYLALYPALCGWICNRFFHNHTKLYYLLVIPCCWTLTEALRSYVLTGFPWMLLGYSQSNSWLSGYAPILGSYGLGTLLLFLAGVIAYFIPRKITGFSCIILFFAVIFGLGYGLCKVNWSTSEDSPIKVSLIQGNIHQSDKWSKEQFFSILNRYNHLIHAELGENIIILPESALPASDWYLHDFLNHLQQLAEQTQSVILLGVPSQTSEMFNNNTYFNALYGLGLKTPLRYSKRHLVPFGEYLTFLSGVSFILDYLQIPMSSFIPGPQKVRPFKLPRTIIQPLICYEIAYSDLVYSNLPEAKAILVVNDDSWFGESAAADQHLQIAQLRAAETRRFILFESNTGITAIINPFGQIIQRIPQNQIAVLRGYFYNMQGMTPIVRYGDSMIFACCLILLLLIKLRHRLAF